MDSSFELPDSTDWIPTSLPAFGPLEAALRCEVCKEFYNNPVITSCNHTFCSICIRRCITADGKCPSCKTGCSSDRLAPNIAVREVVMRFQEARPKALKLARAGKEEESAKHDRKKRKLDDTDIEEDDASRHTRSQQTRSRSQRNRGAADAPVEVADSDDGGDEDFVPEGMAKCPICSRSMKAELVYNHLDVCTGPDASQGRNTRSKAKSAFPIALQRRQREPSPPPTRLSQLNYAMLKEGGLRKKLQEAGIPSWGSKDLMKRRHVEWLNIYNSNCDSDDSVRKNKRQLLRELDEWEQTQGGKADTKESKIMKKDFDGEGYAKSHKTDFDDLIARARQKGATPRVADGEDASKQGKPLDGQHSDPRDTPTNPDSGTDPPPNQGPSNTHPPHNTHNPYENNESALASIRAKVQEANHPAFKGTTLSSERSMESVRQRSSDTSESMQNPCGAPSRKVPMFALPEEPLRDVEGSTAVQ
ncbi:DNA repair protein rad18 [Clathrospora elynae]|uniref:Postreplication repair E3 ubiquitin-protein ligase RAD18 n=1 Tax=Clathrospora elynae TaxID=706981 RepID=A0A6A5SI45_9PLEO|nr:DNA repair protein rad18 [Clathrospora elynae]